MAKGVVEKDFMPEIPEMIPGSISGVLAAAMREVIAPIERPTAEYRHSELKEIIVRNALERISNAAPLQYRKQALHEGGK